MYNKDYATLELDKILARLAAQCSGREAAQRLLAFEPETDINAVGALLEQTQDAHMLIGRFGSPSFGAITDISNSLRRAQAGSTLTMGDLLQVSATLRGIRYLKEWRSHSEGITTCLDGLFMTLTENKFLEEKIDACIISEEEMADTASRELANIRSKIRSAQAGVREKLDKMIRSSGGQKFLQDSIVTMRNGRFVVPVKAEFRSEVPGLVHDTSSSGATVFIEPMGVVETNNEIRVLLSKEREEIERILSNLSADAGQFADKLVCSYKVAVELDIIFARANLAYEMHASMPIINNNGVTNIKRARHPLIDSKKVVPSDIRLGTDFDTLIITGPNTGGKTVVLKTLGLFTLMTMCGLMIPAADNSQIAIYKNVLADIGDEQSIEQSLSTFSAHMTNIKRITEAADGESLVLVDELGAGTDPVEGAALAIAILEYLHFKGARVAATTHYSELKSYAINTPGVENGCCEFNVETLRPTYRLLIGVPGKSNAFAISSKLGITQSIITRAGELVSAENRKFEETVEKLEGFRQQLEQKQNELDEIKVKTERECAEAQYLRERLQKDRDNELELARSEAKRIIESARRQAQSAIDEVEKVRRQQANGQLNGRAAEAKAGLKEKLRRLEEAADPVDQNSNEGYLLPREPVAGDSVLVVDINKTATVIKVFSAQRTAEVQAGIMKMKVSFDNLRLCKPEKEKKSQSSGTRNIKGSQRETSLELDIRGETVEEAMLDVDSFIDNAVLCGVSTVTIIHGKGTGALRAGVHQHLRKHPSVRTFRLGVYGEGENGVTICELK